MRIRKLPHYLYSSSAVTLPSGEVMLYGGEIDYYELLDMHAQSICCESGELTCMCKIVYWFVLAMLNT